jgi:hypothetical protein
MARYLVNHVYAAHTDGTYYGPWTPGETVELEAELAEWINRDSEGTLTELPDPESKPAEREAAKPPNRQHKGSKTR